MVRGFVPAAGLGIDVAIGEAVWFGYALGLLYLFAIPMNPTLRRSIAMIVQSAGVAIGFLVIKKIQEDYFYIARDLALPQRRFIHLLFRFANPIEAEHFDDPNESQNPVRS